MADVLPKIKVTDPHARDASPLSPLSPLERQDTGKLSNKGDGPSTNGKLAAKLRSPTSPTPSSEPAAQNRGSAEGRQQSETPIDPLSQQILQRTNTLTAIQKLRSQTTDNASLNSPTSPNDAKADSKQVTETAREISGASNPRQDKKKGVSFLSRFIGNKKAKGLDGADDNGSEAGDLRPEGMNAQLFSHTVDNLGFSPKHPQPPAYIKVRTKYKRQKEFDHLFLAQELRSGRDKKSAPAAGCNPAPQSGSAASHNPIWAVEFSKDGKYLAAGGQDRVVRVWAVISSAEERRAHEKHESNPNASSGESTHLSAPVFQQKTFREYEGHTATILDLSWSKNNFLLSSSMDKTVRLWHISRAENLCTFKHSDFVPSIQFHPRDDRFFLAGSLDSKLRLWSIPDKSVAYWTQLPDMITAVSFTPDGKTAIAGTLGGLCMFYDTEGLKLQTHIHVKSTRGQNAKGSKVTGIQAMFWPPGKTSGEVKLLISSNDSRVRLYNFKDKTLEMKFRGHENSSSQIRATIADDTGHVICGSEDRKAYIWSTSANDTDKRNQRPVEIFDANNSITTCAIMAPLKTRQLLSASEDPIFDLCNPPPVTLVSRNESANSSRAPTESGSALPTPATVDTQFTRVAESPAYIARSAHTNGNIFVTADYTGAIKVFRQDCAYTKRLRASENWDASSVFSKRTGGSKMGRPSSVISRGPGRNRRDSTATQPPDDRIMSWRQDMEHAHHSSLDSTNGPATPRRSHARSSSPRKSVRLSMTSSRAPPDSPALGPTIVTTSPVDSKPKSSLSVDQPSTSSEAVTNPDLAPPRSPSQASSFDPVKPDTEKEKKMANPLSVYNGQSWAFWSSINGWRDKASSGDERPVLGNRLSTVSKLSSEEVWGEGVCGKGEGDWRDGGEEDGV
ncbi:WD40 repeat-like protein [Corynespora cassiicola Philippines]|uniref:WD40 repeat-like protein n=1 Tax=Corynespora cassiicola Philippines TaxID=1448308 RepID=A0A2T2NLL7_CORCC|nr:WD40 repeat-like protein [Corynespora cassiicola Philippines]